MPMLPNQCSVKDPAYIRRVSELAYRYWEGRGRPIGSAEDDWFCAEHEIASEGGAYGILRFDQDEVGGT
jgi:hypothetical protein